MTTDPDPLHERTRDASRSDLKLLDDKPREEMRETAEIGDDVAELLD